MRIRKSYNRIAVLLAAVLMLTASIGLTVAYFTDYYQASGNAKLSLTTDTQIFEGTSDTEKNVYVKNTGETNMMVRVKFFGPEQMVVDTEVNGWTYDADGWFYYNTPLEPGAETADKINAKIVIKAEGMSDEDVAKKIAELGDTLQIAVVHEAVIEAYDDNGKLILPADWNYPQK